MTQVPFLSGDAFREIDIAEFASVRVVIFFLTDF